MDTEVVEGNEKLTSEVRLRIQEAALELLSEQEAAGFVAHQLYVLVEELQIKLRTHGTPLSLLEIHRAMSEDPCFYGRSRLGGTLFFLKLK